MKKLIATTSFLLATLAAGSAFAEAPPAPPGADVVTSRAADAAMGAHNQRRARAKARASS